MINLIFDHDNIKFFWSIITLVSIEFKKILICLKDSDNMFKS